MKKPFLFLIALLYCSMIKAQTSDTVTNKINNVPYRNCTVFTKFTEGNIYNYLAKNIQYPIGLQKSVSGEVVTSMLVNTDGIVSDIQVFKNLSPEIDNEIVRVLSKSPKWIPAQLNGEDVKINVVLLINIAAEANNKKIIVTKYQYPKLPVHIVTDTTTAVFIAVQKPPLYPGGDDSLHRYLNKNMVYPSNLLKKKKGGQVWVSFIVEKDGSATDIKVVRSPNEGFNAECIRVTKTLKYINGTQNGYPVRVLNYLTIKFDPSNPSKH